MQEEILAWLESSISRRELGEIIIINLRKIWIKSTRLLEVSNGSLPREDKSLRIATRVARRPAERRCSSPVAPLREEFTQASSEPISEELISHGEVENIA